MGMERQFRLGIPHGQSTLSIPRNMSAINRKLVSSEEAYRVSIRFSPLAGTTDGLVQASSSPTSWVHYSIWNQGKRLREAFYEAMAIDDDDRPDFPIPLIESNPYDEFRPYLDEYHRQNRS